MQYSTSLRNSINIPIVSVVVDSGYLYISYAVPSVSLSTFGSTMFSTMIVSQTNSVISGSHYALAEPKKFDEINAKVDALLSERRITNRTNMFIASLG